MENIILIGQATVLIKGTGSDWSENWQPTFVD